MQAVPPQIRPSQEWAQLLTQALIDGAIVSPWCHPRVLAGERLPSWSGVITVPLVTFVPRQAPWPLQCLGALFRVLTAKAGRPARQAQDAVLDWMDAFPVLESNAAAWRGAMDLCVANQLASWDALVLNVAAEGGARLLLTEETGFRDQPCQLQQNGPMTINRLPGPSQRLDPRCSPHPDAEDLSPAGHRFPDPPEE